MGGIWLQRYESLGDIPGRFRTFYGRLEIGQQIITFANFGIICKNSAYGYESSEDLPLLEEEPAE